MSNLILDHYTEETISSTEEVKSFFKINHKDKKELLTWLNAVCDALKEQSITRTSQQRDNLSVYRGLPIRTRSFDQNGKRLNQLNKFVIPHIHDLTEVRVSQMTRIKPTVDVMPANSEWEDRSSAKVVELIIKHLWYINNIDYLFQNFHRYARIFGESYLWAEWDESKGDLHPLYVQARDQGLDVEPIKTGDIKYSCELPWRVFLQRKPTFDEVEYCFRLKLIPTDILQAKYPKADIKRTEDLRTFDLDQLADRLLENHTVVCEFWHKATNEMPNGFYAEFTQNAVLFSGDHPYQFKGFPFIRLTDLDVPDALNGVSKYELVMPTFNMLNNINTLIAKNIWLTAHAKWMVPRGAAKIEQLGNTDTVVQYQGAVPPSLAQISPNPPEVYNYAETLLRSGQTIYGNHGISRGEIPTGITATSALTYLNELESQRATTDISKHSTAVVDLAKLTMCIVGDKYSNDDQRLIRIVGKNNQFNVRHFDAAHLHKAYDIRFNTGSGLPDTKSGKRQIILDMMQRNPTGNSMERWEELLEVGNVEKAIDLQTVAIRSADSENEDIAAGRPVSHAEAWEDHIIHLQSHYKFMQSRQFKEEMPKERRDALTDHVFWTEEIALMKAQTSPLFEAQLASLPLFPIFNHPTYPIPRSFEQQATQAAGMANITGGQAPGVSIPGQPLPEKL